MAFRGGLPSGSTKMGGALLLLLLLLAVVVTSEVIACLGSPNDRRGASSSPSSPRAAGGRAPGESRADTSLPTGPPRLGRAPDPTPAPRRGESAGAEGLGVARLGEGSGSGGRSAPAEGRPPNGSDYSPSADPRAPATSAGGRSSFKARKPSRRGEIPVDATEEVTGNATNDTGEADARTCEEELRRSMAAPEAGERLASMESLSREELSPLPSLARFRGPATRSLGKRPAFLRVSEMMVNSMRSLEQEYPSEENVIEQENLTENIMKHDDQSVEHQVEERGSAMTHYKRSRIKRPKNEVDPRINEDFHLEQELTSEEHNLKQEHPSQGQHLEHEHASKVHSVQQITDKNHRLQGVRASGVPQLDTVMATSDVASGGRKTATGFSSPVLNDHIKVAVDGTSATTGYHRPHSNHINVGPDNFVLNETSPGDAQTSQKTVSKWRETGFTKRRKETSLTKSSEKFLGTSSTSSPSNVTTELLRRNYTGFLETHDNVTKTKAPPAVCSSSTGRCSDEESNRNGIRELTQLVTALQPQEPEAPQHDSKGDEERLPLFPEKYDLHHTSKVKERLQFQGHGNSEKDQERVIFQLSQETSEEDKTGGGYTAGTTESRDEVSEIHKQKILASSLDTKRRYLRTFTSGLDKSSQTKAEDNIEGLSPANKRQQSGEKTERTRPQEESPLDLHDTSHLKASQGSRIKRNSATLTDGTSDAALAPDEGSGEVALNATRHLPGRYHSLLRTRSRKIFRGLGTEPRSDRPAGGTRKGGGGAAAAGGAAVANGPRAPSGGPLTAPANLSQDLHLPGDFGVLRETRRQGALPSSGSRADEGADEAPRAGPPDYSYLPPGFSGIDNGRGCSCWQTHDDSFMKEVECRCQGEHVVQLPANLSTNVDRLTLTKTSVESLGHQNLSQYKSALQELILRDAKKLRKMETDCFREMKRLRTIYISHAPRLVALPPHIFHAFLPSLKVLRIVYTGLAELPSLTQLATNNIIHMVDLENNKIQRIRGSSVNIKTEQLLLDNNMLDTVEARAFHGSQIGKLSMKGNLRLTDLHPLAFKGLKSLISLDLSETGISHLPTVGLEGLETLRLVRTYNLKVFPSVYSFKSITTAELTYHYHCCAFKFPKLHDPAEHKKHEEFLRRMEKEQCGEVTSTSSVTGASQVGLGRRRRRRVAPEPHPSPQPHLEPHPGRPHQPRAEGGAGSSTFRLPSNAEGDHVHSFPPRLPRRRRRRRRRRLVSTKFAPSASLTPSPSTSSPSLSTPPTPPSSTPPSSPASTPPTTPPSTPPASPPSTSSSTPPSTPSPPSRITTPEGLDASSQDLFVFTRVYEGGKFLGKEKVVIIGAGGQEPRPGDQPRQYHLQGRQHHRAEKNRLNSEGAVEGRGHDGTRGTGSQQPTPAECQNGPCARGHKPGLLQHQTSDGELSTSTTTTEPVPGAPDDFSGPGDENDESRTRENRQAGPVRPQMGLDVFIDVQRGGSDGRGAPSNADGPDTMPWVNSNPDGVPLSHWALGDGVRDRTQRVASTLNPGEAEHIPNGFSEHEEGFSSHGFSEMDDFGFPEHHGFDVGEGLGAHLSSYPGGGAGVDGFGLDDDDDDDDHGFPDDYDPDECVNGLCPKTARLPPPHGPTYPFDPNSHFDANYPFESVEVFHSSDAFRPVIDTSVEGATDHSGSPHGKFHRKVSLSQGVKTVCRGNLSKNYRDVQCVPEPDAFNPCEDIMGNLGLRVAVWLVVVTAVFGNLAVMVVLMSTRFKMTVSKFLMCNLAGADLCMGLYLLIIAAMDLRTIGVYFNYAIDWQNGPGCKVAGFLTVFASELSILTLTVITLERWYAITYAIHLNKRLRLSVAVKVMVLAWLYALTMATLPLLGVSGYSKTSICLPMETVDGGDRAYLLILLITNGLAFVLICVCYAKMYCSIAGNNLAANTSDTTVAKRMALLVFTDFACWAPIAFFGLTAVSGYPLISVTHAKFLLVFFYPLNSCANPYLYAILTKQYRRDLFILLARHGFCTKRAMKYKGGYSTNTWLNHHNVCVSGGGGAGGGAAGPGRRISTLTQITTCGDWRSRVRDGSEESLGRQCSPSRASRSVSAELTAATGPADRRPSSSSDAGRRLRPAAGGRDAARPPPKPGAPAPTSGSPHPIKNCYARMSFTPEQEALLLRYASDRQPSATPASARRRASPSDGNEAVPLSIYTPTTPDTISTPISPQLDHSV